MTTRANNEWEPASVTTAITGAVTKSNFVIAAALAAAVPHHVTSAVAEGDYVEVAYGIVGKHRNIVVVTPDDRCRWWNEAAAGDLVHRAVAVRPAACRCAEQVAVGIGDKAAARLGTVGEVEVDQSGWGAGIAVGGLGDLEHRAVAGSAVRPAGCRRAEQVTVSIGDQAAERKET